MLIRNKKSSWTLAVVIILILIIVVFSLIKRSIRLKELKEEFIDVESRITFELIGEMEFDETVENKIEFTYIDYFNDDEIISETIVDYPVHKRLYNLEDQKLFEKLYDIDIPFEFDYTRKYIYVVVGSEIEAFEILRVHEDELSDYKPRYYDTSIHYKKDFNANILYFYFISDERLWLYDENTILK